jgi:hypothetical protein
LEFRLFSRHEKIKDSETDDVMTDTTLDTTVFGNYTEELMVLFKEIESLSHSQSVETSTTLLQQCQGILQQMSVEARIAESMEQRRSFMEQYHSYRKQYEVLKQRIDRQMLVNTTRDGGGSGSTNLSHSTLQSTEQNLVNQNRIVEDSLKSIHETEQVAIETMEHLQNQRNTLEHTRDNTKSVQSLTQQANQIATNLLKPWWRKGV